MQPEPNYTVQNPKSALPPILLLHGWGGSLKSLTSLQTSLSEIQNNPIYNLELPGFGQTTMPEKQMNTEAYAKFVIDFIELKELKNVVLIGHSFGGKISLDITSKQTPTVEKLVLINSSGIKPMNTIKKNLAKFIKKRLPSKIQDNKKLKNIFYKYILREHDYLNAGRLKQSLSVIVEEHYDDKLQIIKIPTLIIWSENDSYVPLWMGEKVHDEIVSSKLIVVPQATHGLPIKEPDLVAELISQWLPT